MFRKTLLVAALLLPGMAHAAATLTVDARDNIYAIGMLGDDQYDGGGLPPVSFSVKPGETLTFDVTGQMSMNIGTGSNENDPDGVGAAVPGSSNTGAGAIAGIAAPNAGYLVGVFVPPDGPHSPPPPPLDFTAPGATSFTSLSPQLGQVFFIGDGLTGDGNRRAPGLSPRARRGGVPVSRYPAMPAAITAHQAGIRTMPVFSRWWSHRSAMTCASWRSSAAAWAWLPHCCFWRW